MFVIDNDLQFNLLDTEQFFFLFDDKFLRMFSRKCYLLFPRGERSDNFRLWSILNQFFMRIVELTVFDVLLLLFPNFT